MSHRPPYLFAALALGIWMAWPSGVAAQQAAQIDTDNRLLQQGLQLVEEVEYERAVEVLSAALLEQGNTADELTVIYRTLGTLYVFLGREAEAEAALRRLLCEDPEWRFNEYTSPRIREVFDRVRDQWIDQDRPCEFRGQPQVEPVTIDHESPASATRGESLELRIAIDDPGMRVTTVVLMYRASGEQGFDEMGAAAVGPGAYFATIPGDAIQPPAAEYYLIARDGHGEQVATLGTARAPLRVPLRDEPVGQRPSIARSWWFWTIIGVAVVGTALGLGLGLGLQDGGSGSEHTITIRVCDAEDPGSCFN